MLVYTYPTPAQVVALVTQKFCVASPKALASNSKARLAAALLIRDHAVGEPLTSFPFHTGHESVQAFQEACSEALTLNQIDGTFGKNVFALRHFILKKRTTSRTFAPDASASAIANLSASASVGR